MKSPQPPDPTKPRYQQIAEDLEADIARGIYGVGARLPAERELSRQLGASYLTVRQGVGELVKKGLLRREQGRGTYVLAQTVAPIIAVVFGPCLVDESAHFYRAILKTLQSEIHGTPFAYRCYDGFNLADPTTPNEAIPYRHLLKDLRSHPIQGLIAISLEDLKWMDLAPLRGVPCARFNENDGDVTLDCSVFFHKAMEFVTENGCRNILCLSHPNQSDPNEEKEVTAKEPDRPALETRLLENNGQPFDVQAHNLVSQLALDWKETGATPDAIIVSDDIATRGVAMALSEARIKVPNKTLLVNLANEGIDHHYGVTTIRYVISSTEIVRNLLTALEKRLQGQPVRERHVVVGNWASDPANVTAEPLRVANLSDNSPVPSSTSRS